MKGNVLLFDNQKGWGFIRGSDNKDYFVHYSNIENNGKRNLYEEEIVSFEIGKGTNGKGNHIKTIKDQYGKRKYIVFNSDNIMQTDECGMSFKELVAYAGIII